MARNILIKMFEAPFIYLESILGIPYDQLKLVFCMLIATPLGYTQWSLLRSPTIRHVFSIVAGSFMGLLMYGPNSMKLPLISSCIVYMMLCLLPRSRVGLPVLIFCMIFQSGVHIYRMITDWMGWSMDVANVQMILTCKLSSLAYSYQDAVTFHERVPKSQEGLAVSRLPNILEYFSYVCFYPGIVMGPPFEYMDYYRFVNEKDEFAKIPNPILPALKPFGLGFLFLFMISLLGNIFDPTFYYTEDFATLSLLYRFLHLNIAAMLIKARFTTGWKFAEAAMIASGFAYSPGESYEWKRGLSLYWWKMEWGWNAKDVADNWNIRVALWIRRYIYNRILISGDTPSPTPLRRSVAQHISFLVSALWHGFYPLYYFMFFSYSLLAEVSKMTYNSDWSFLPMKGVFKWAAWFLMWQTINCMVVGFMILDLRLVWVFLSMIHYYPLVIIVSGWIFFKVTGVHRKNRKSGNKVD